MKHPDDRRPDPVTDADDAPAAAPPREGWWEAALTRREAAQRAGVGLGGLAVLLGAAGLGGVAACGRSDDEGLDDDKVEPRDAIEVQKQVGWAVGAEDQTLRFNTTPMVSDSQKGTDWQRYKQPASLLGATSPKQEAWRGFAAPTLFQALEQKTLADQMRPTRSGDVIGAYARGPALASLMAAAEEPGKTLLIVDMPGPQAVGLAAGMADKVEPVFHFDNWPHPRGVVPSHDTLGATLYYAAELEAKKAQRPEGAPVALVLDKQRLSQPTSESTQFDNRYVATLPSAKALKERGIERVMYVTERPIQTESDDLNDDMVAYADAGLKTAMVPLSAFERDESVAQADSETNGYYYGGSRQTHGGFYAYYPMFIWLPGPSPRWGSATPRTVARPQYRPAPRPTVFSARTTGGAAGVGRTKPTGFGRVSARVNASGHVVGTRYGTTSRGTSGSYGRSRSNFGGG